MRENKRRSVILLFAVLIASFFCAQTASSLNYSGGSYDGYSSGSNGYLITPSAGANGTISPGTATVVQLGASQSFTIEATTGYHIDTVRMDGAATSEGSGASSYTYIFNSVNAIHTIEALFSINTYTITAESGANGTIEPLGIVTKDYGSSQTYTITPNANYMITDVLVDGTSEGAVSSYTFNSISGSHTIIASFELDSSKNLLTNGDAQTGDFTGWNLINYGSGWANGDIGGGNRAFLSSYYSPPGSPASATDYCAMYQEVDLVSKGYSPSYLDSAPQVDISASIYANADPLTLPNWYRVTVELRDASHNVIASFETTKKSLTSNTIEAHTFTGYGSGLRYIYFWQGGHDNPWWAGNYGAQFDDSVVLVTASPVFTVEASSGPNGSISPSGSIITGEGFDMSLQISAEAGYQISHLTIDGSATTEGSGLSNYTYTFRNISANHSIEAHFSNPFVSTWNTANTSTGSSNNNQIRLPLVSSGTYNFTVNWGDGSSETITAYNQPGVTHTYASSGIYTLNITGTIEGWKTSGSQDKLKITNISNWGPFKLGNDGSYFNGTSNLKITATDILDLTGTTNLSYAFALSGIDNVPSMNSWDVSNVINMGNVFANAALFNQNISSWDVRNVTDMNGIFSGTTVFNQNIGSWDVSKVTNMSYMFYNARAFNQNIGSWNVSKAANMGYMFSGATVFNQNIGSWDVSSVTNASSMFNGVTLSTANYNSLLIGWAALSSLESSVAFSGGSSKYSGAALSARNTLTGAPNNWIITDGGIKTWTITPTAGSNGSISPATATTTNDGSSTTFTFTPNSGYSVSQVLVDGVATTAAASYTFTNVTANHTIEADFDIAIYTITSEAGANGTIEPLGILIKSGTSSQTYAITPGTGYHVSDVLVDSVSLGATAEYTFSNISANHTIVASFEIDSFIITSEAAANGTISPSGTTAKNYGSSQTYTITADSGSEVLDVLVDSVSVGAVTSYTFGSIEANHIISATFRSSISTPSAESFSNVTSTVIKANWGANGNPAGTEYYCENITAGTNSGWVAGLNWTSSSLEVSTVYAFRVKARCSASSESGWTSLGSQETAGYSTSEASVAGVNLENGDTISGILTITVSLTSEAAISSSSLKTLATMGGIRSVQVDGVDVAYDIISTTDFTITLKLRDALSAGTHTVRIVTYDTAGTEYVLERTGLVVSSGEVTTSGPTLLYPNPYDPLAGDLKITYYLSVDTNTTIYVIDKTGRLVWKSNYLSGVNGGKAGYNEITWNTVGLFGQLTSDAYIVSVIEQGTGKVITKTKLLLWKGGAR